MLNDPTRSTIDGYEFQEYCCGSWEYSHTDIGYYTMLENKREYADNQRRGGNPFRIIKRRLKKSEETTASLNRFEVADLKAKIRVLTKGIENNPDTLRSKNRKWRIEQAEKRIEKLQA